ncbi:hypothetical protein BDN72DRAFT_386572 [Pluteus cervinus]|uniref:Uncharacterized protein n=1 Tax=Pluteus cervinus TaxID=181527 RepID=A0ACD3AA47_9AGAR|nr:hypothetical protein BDN72DRAFT_386572 [Pluteus cervinus]
MMSDKIMKFTYPVLMGLLLLAALIEMCISAWLISQYNKFHNFSSGGQLVRTRYILFTSIWTLIFGSLYLVGFLLMPIGYALTGVVSHLIFLFFTWALWTGAAAAITQMLGGGLHCSSQDAFVYCGQLNALEGFAWLIWIVLTILFFLVIIRGITTANHGEGSKGSLIDGFTA